MLISKKELLAETNISYGQLYRWKRERLIPEEWFIKQSTFTGQETFFPKEQIINRIRTIQELKDKYSLEELATLFSPEVSKHGYKIEELEFMQEMKSDVIDVYRNFVGEDSISYMELLILVILSQLKDELHMTTSQIGDMLKGILPNLENIKSTGYILSIYSNGDGYVTVVYQDQTQIFFDERYQMVKKVRIHDYSNQLRIKYGKNFEPQDSYFDKEEQTEKYSDDNSTSEQQQENVNQEDSKQQNTDNENNNEKDPNGEDFILKFKNWEVRL